MSTRTSFALLAAISIATLLPSASATAQPRAPLSYHGPIYNLSPDRPRFGFLIGYHGVDYPTLEAGFGIVGLGTPPKEMHSPFSIVASVEMYPGERLVVAPRLSFWGTWLYLTAGIGGGYYTDGVASSVRIRPEVGIGGVGIEHVSVRMTFGVNLRISGTDPKEVNKGELGIQMLLPVVDI